MKTLFREYFYPSDTDIKEVWNDALIVFDTCALLNLYRYTEKTRESFIKILEAYKDRLWIPYQVAKEFLQDKKEVIKSQEKAYDEIIRQLDRIKGGDISEEDMDGARKMLVNQYLTVTDELFSSDSYYLNSYMGNQEISKEEFIEGINSVTAEDIKACAQKLSLDTVYFLTSPDDLKDGE